MTDETYLDEGTIEQPDEETRLKGTLRQLTGYDDTNDDHPSIDPEAVEKNRDAIRDTILKLKEPLSERASSERQLKIADAIADITSLDASAESVLSSLERLENLYQPATTPVLESAPERGAVDEYNDEFLIEGWMPANRLTILTGEGGAGKSYLALQHICGLVMGVPDLALAQYDGNLDDYWQNQSHYLRKDSVKIVIASYEEDLMQTWKRLALICDRLEWPDYEKLREQIKFVDLKMFGPIWGVDAKEHLAHRARLLEIGDWLFDQCQQTEARLLMMDPSAAAFGGNEIQRESVREFCSYLNGWGQQVECATLLIAHPPKSGDDYSGSTDWRGSCRAMWTLKSIDPTERHELVYRVKRVPQPTKKEIEDPDPKTRLWYQLTNVKGNYAAPQNVVYLERVATEKDGRRVGWTPIWKQCTDHETAQDFVEEYWKPTTDSDNLKQQEERDYEPAPDITADAV